MNTIERNAIHHEKEHRRSNDDIESGRIDGDAVPAGTFSLRVVNELSLTSTADQQHGPPDLPPLRGLSFLDRFLVVWILIAMGVGIAIGNTVDSVGPALQKGEFVGVSIPIGTSLLPLPIIYPKF